MRTILLVALIILTTTSARAQFILQDAHTTASLRGIHSIGNGIAWASGTEGTVLRTTDEGATWQRCTTPPDAEKLDFRGIQAFDQNTAIVMSPGKGDLSRLYKTTDACKTWKLVFTNPDKDGFWDAIQAKDAEWVLVLGDSVGEERRIWEWQQDADPQFELNYQAKGHAQIGEGSFAASNSVLQIVSTPKADPVWKYALRWSSGTADKAYISIVRDEETATCEPCREEHLKVETPLAGNSSTAGIFSFNFRSELVGVAVGGDYKKSDQTAATCMHTNDGGQSWSLAQTPPRGYRSSVAYNSKTKSWITVGPNGTDISRDDGRNWTALKPTAQDPPDANRNWNALSLPFVVGPKGRIGKLRPEALKP
jgi:photosystem II stability/assembly factor-like uncharacterized protein